MFKYLFIFISSVVVENRAFLTTSTAVGLTAKNPVLMRLLQTVDAATTDERLLDVSLQLLKSLCVCMRETLKAKQLESASFSGDNNSVQADDKNKDQSKKVLDIYQNIYNKTCFDLKNEVASKVNKSAYISSDEEKEFILKSDCGKAQIPDINTNIYEEEGRINETSDANETRLEDILYQTFIKTRSYHKFRTRKYSLYKHTKQESRVPGKHNIIVILTFYPVNDTSSLITNCTKLTDELNNTLHTHSPIDIDIIDARFGQKENITEESLKPKEAPDCTLKSIYAFLLQSEKYNKTKVFKLMHRNNTIKVYIDVNSEAYHSDYTRMCCCKKTNEPMCKIDFINESFDSKEITTSSYTKQKTGHFKETILKIKTLVKLYDKKLMNKKLKRSSTYKTLISQNDFITKSDYETHTEKLETAKQQGIFKSFKNMSGSDLMPNYTDIEELWMNRIVFDESSHEKNNKWISDLELITLPYNKVTVSPAALNKKHDLVTNRKPTSLFNNEVTKYFTFPNEHSAPITEKDFLNFTEKKNYKEEELYLKSMNKEIEKPTDIINPQIDRTTRRKLTYWDQTTYYPHSTSPTTEKPPDIASETIMNPRLTGSSNVISTISNLPIENTLEIVVTTNNKQKKISLHDLFVDPHLKAIQKLQTAGELKTNNNHNLSKPSVKPNSADCILSICISLTKKQHSTENELFSIKTTNTSSIIGLDNFITVKDTDIFSDISKIEKLSTEVTTRASPVTIDLEIVNNEIIKKDEEIPKRNPPYKVTNLLVTLEPQSYLPTTNVHNSTNNKITVDISNLNQKQSNTTIFQNNHNDTLDDHRDTHEYSDLRPFNNLNVSIKNTPIEMKNILDIDNETSMVTINSNPTEMTDIFTTYSNSFIKNRIITNVANQVTLPTFIKDRNTLHHYLNLSQQSDPNHNIEYSLHDYLLNTETENMPDTTQQIFSSSSIVNGLINDINQNNADLNYTITKQQNTTFSDYVQNRDKLEKDNKTHNDINIENFAKGGYISQTRNDISNEITSDDNATNIDSLFVTILSDNNDIQAAGASSNQNIDPVTYPVQNITLPQAFQTIKEINDMNTLTNIPYRLKEGVSINNHTQHFTLSEKGHTFEKSPEQYKIYKNYLYLTEKHIENTTDFNYNIQNAILSTNDQNSSGLESDNAKKYFNKSVNITPTDNYSLKFAFFNESTDKVNLHSSLLATLAPERDNDYKTYLKDFADELHLNESKSEASGSNSKFSKVKNNIYSNYNPTAKLQHTNTTNLNYTLSNAEKAENFTTSSKNTSPDSIYSVNQKVHTMTPSQVSSPIYSFLPKPMKFTQEPTVTSPEYTNAIALPSEDALNTIESGINVFNTITSHSIDIKEISHTTHPYSNDEHETLTTDKLYDDYYTNHGIYNTDVSNSIVTQSIDNSPLPPIINDVNQQKQNKQNQSEVTESDLSQHTILPDRTLITTTISELGYESILPKYLASTIEINKHTTPVYINTKNMYGSITDAMNYTAASDINTLNTTDPNLKLEVLTEDNYNRPPIDEVDKKVSHVSFSSEMPTIRDAYSLSDDMDTSFSKDLSFDTRPTTKQYTINETEQEIIQTNDIGSSSFQINNTTLPLNISTQNFNASITETMKHSDSPHINILNTTYPPLKLKILIEDNYMPPPINEVDKNVSHISVSSKMPPISDVSSLSGDMDTSFSKDLSYDTKLTTKQLTLNEIEQEIVQTNDIGSSSFQINKTTLPLNIATQNFNDSITETITYSDSSHIKNLNTTYPPLKLETLSEDTHFPLAGNRSQIMDSPLIDPGNFTTEVADKLSIILNETKTYTTPHYVGNKIENNILTLKVTDASYIQSNSELPINLVTKHKYDLLGQTKPFRATPYPINENEIIQSKDDDGTFEMHKGTIAAVIGTPEITESIINDQIEHEKDNAQSNNTIFSSLEITENITPTLIATQTIHDAVAGVTKDIVASDTDGGNLDTDFTNDIFYDTMTYTTNQYPLSTIGNEISTPEDVQPSAFNVDNILLISKVSQNIDPISEETVSTDTPNTHTDDNNILLSSDNIAINIENASYIRVSPKTAPVTAISTLDPKFTEDIFSDTNPVTTDKYQTSKVGDNIFQLPIFSTFQLNQDMTPVLIATETNNDYLTDMSKNNLIVETDAPALDTDFNNDTFYDMKLYKKDQYPMTEITDENIQSKSVSEVDTTPTKSKGSQKVDPATEATLFTGAFDTSSVNSTYPSTTLNKLSDDNNILFSRDKIGKDIDYTTNISVLPNTASIKTISSLGPNFTNDIFYDTKSVTTDQYSESDIKDDIIQSTNTAYSSFKINKDSTIPVFGHTQTIVHAVTGNVLLKSESANLSKDFTTDMFNHINSYITNQYPPSGIDDEIKQSKDVNNISFEITNTLVKSKLSQNITDTVTEETVSTGAFNTISANNTPESFTDFTNILLSSDSNAKHTEDSSYISILPKTVPVTAMSTLHPNFTKDIFSDPKPATTDKYPKSEGGDDIFQQPVFSTFQHYKDMTSVFVATETNNDSITDAIKNTVNVVSDTDNLDTVFTKDKFYQPKLYTTNQLSMTEIADEPIKSNDTQLITSKVDITSLKSKVKENIVGPATKETVFTEAFGTTLSTFNRYFTKDKYYDTKPNNADQYSKSEIKDDFFQPNITTFSSFEIIKDITTTLIANQTNNGAVAGTIKDIVALDINAADLDTDFTNDKFAESKLYTTDQYLINDIADENIKSNDTQFVTSKVDITPLKSIVNENIVDPVTKETALTEAFDTTLSTLNPYLTKNKYYDTKPNNTDQYSKNEIKDDLFQPNITTFSSFEIPKDITTTFIANQITDDAVGESINDIVALDTDAADLDTDLTNNKFYNINAFTTIRYPLSEIDESADVKSTNQSADVKSTNVVVNDTFVQSKFSPNIGVQLTEAIESTETSSTPATETIIDSRTDEIKNNVIFETDADDLDKVLTKDVFNDSKSYTTDHYSITENYNESNVLPSSFNNTPMKSNENENIVEPAIEETPFTAVYDTTSENITYPPITLKNLTDETYILISSNEIAKNLENLSYTSVLKPAHVTTKSLKPNFTTYKFYKTTPVTNDKYPKTEIGDDVFPLPVFSTFQVNHDTTPVFLATETKIGSITEVIKNNVMKKTDTDFTNNVFYESKLNTNDEYPVGEIPYEEIQSDNVKSSTFKINYTPVKSNENEITNDITVADIFTEISATTSTTYPPPKFNKFTEYTNILLSSDEFAKNTENVKFTSVSLKPAHGIFTLDSDFTTDKYYDTKPVTTDQYTGIGFKDNIIQHKITDTSSFEMNKDTTPLVVATQTINHAVSGTIKDTVILGTGTNYLDSDFTTDVFNDIKSDTMNQDEFTEIVNEINETESVKSSTFKVNNNTMKIKEREKNVASITQENVFTEGSRITFVNTTYPPMPLITLSDDAGITFSNDDTKNIGYESYINVSPKEPVTTMFSLDPNFSKDRFNETKPSQSDKLPSTEIKYDIIPPDYDVFSTYQGDNDMAPVVIATQIYSDSITEENKHKSLETGADKFDTKYTNDIFYESKSYTTDRYPISNTDDKNIQSNNNNLKVNNILPNDELSQNIVDPLTSINTTYPPMNLNSLTGDIIIPHSSDEIAVVDASTVSVSPKIAPITTIPTLDPNLNKDIFYNAKPITPDQYSKTETEGDIFKPGYAAVSSLNMNTGKIPVFHEYITEGIKNNVIFETEAHDMDTDFTNDMFYDSKLYTTDQYSESKVDDETIQSKSDLSSTLNIYNTQNIFDPETEQIKNTGTFVITSPSTPYLHIKLNSSAIEDTNFLPSEHINNSPKIASAGAILTLDPIFTKDIHDHTQSVETDRYPNITIQPKTGVSSASEINKDTTPVFKTTQTISGSVTEATKNKITLNTDVNLDTDFTNDTFYFTQSFTTERYSVGEIDDAISYSKEESSGLEIDNNLPISEASEKNLNSTLAATETNSSTDIQLLSTAYLESITEGTTNLPTSDDNVKNIEHTNFTIVLPELTPVANVNTLSNNSDTFFTNAMPYSTIPFTSDQYPIIEIDKDDIDRSKDMKYSTFEINNTIPVSEASEKDFHSTISAIKTATSSVIESLSPKYLESITEGTAIFPSSDDIVKNIENTNLINVFPEIEPTANILELNNNSDTYFTDGMSNVTKPFTSNQYPIRKIDNDTDKPKEIEYSTFEINTIPINIGEKHFDSATGAIKTTSSSEFEILSTKYLESETKGTNILPTSNGIVKHKESSNFIIPEITPMANILEFDNNSDTYQTGSILDNTKPSTADQYRINKVDTNIYPSKKVIYKASEIYDTIPISAASQEIINSVSSSMKTNTDSDSESITNTTPSSDDIVNKLENASLINILPERTSFTKIVSVHSDIDLTENPITNQINKMTTRSITNVYTTTANFSYIMGQSLTNDENLPPGDKITAGTENTNQLSMLSESKPGTITAALHDKFNEKFNTNILYTKESTKIPYETNEVEHDIMQSKVFDAKTFELNNNLEPISTINQTTIENTTEVTEHTATLDTVIADIDVDLNKEIYDNAKLTTNQYATKTGDEIINSKEVGFSTFIDKKDVPFSTIRASHKVNHSSTFVTKILYTSYPPNNPESITEDSNVLVSGDKTEKYTGNDRQISLLPITAPITTDVIKNTNERNPDGEDIEIDLNKDIYYKYSTKLITNQYPTEIGDKIIHSREVEFSTIPKDSNFILFGDKIDKYSKNDSLITVLPITEPFTVPTTFSDKLTTNKDMFYNKQIYSMNQDPISHIGGEMITPKDESNIMKIQKTPKYTSTLENTDVSSSTSFSTTLIQQNVTESNNILLQRGRQSLEKESKLSTTSKTEPILNIVNLEKNLDKKKINNSASFENTYPLNQRERIPKSIPLADDNIVQKSENENQTSTSSQTQSIIKLALNDNLETDSTFYTTYPQSEPESMTTGEESLKLHHTRNDSQILISVETTPITNIPLFADHLETDFSGKTLLNTKPYWADDDTTSRYTDKKNNGYDKKLKTDYTITDSYDTNSQLHEVPDEASPITVPLNKYSNFAKPYLATQHHIVTIVPFERTDYTIFNTRNDFAQLQSFTKDSNGLLSQITTNEIKTSPSTDTDGNYNLTNTTDSSVYITQAHIYNDYTNSIKTTVNNFKSQAFKSGNVDRVTSNLDDTKSTKVKLNTESKTEKTSNPEHSIINMINHIKKILKKERKFTFSSGFDITLPKPGHKHHHKNKSDHNLSKYNKNITSNKAPAKTTNDFKFESWNPAKLVIHTLPKNNTDKMNIVIPHYNINNYRSSLLPNTDSKVFYILKNSGDTFKNTTNPSFMNTLGVMATRNETDSSNPYLDQRTILELKGDVNNAPNKHKTVFTTSFTTNNVSIANTLPLTKPTFNFTTSETNIRPTSDLNTETLDRQTYIVTENAPNVSKQILDHNKTPFRTQSNNSGVNTKVSPLWNTSFDHLTTTSPDIPKDLDEENVSYKLIKQSKGVIATHSTNSKIVQTTSRPRDVLVFPNVLNAPSTPPAIEHNLIANYDSTVSSDIMNSLTIQDSPTFLNQNTSSTIFKKHEKSPITNGAIAFDSVSDYQKYIDTRKSLFNDSLSSIYQGTDDYHIDGMQAPYKDNKNRSIFKYINQNTTDKTTKTNTSLTQSFLAADFSNTHKPLDTKPYAIDEILNGKDNKDTYVMNYQLTFDNHTKDNELPTVTDSYNYAHSDLLEQVSQNITPYSPIIHKDSSVFLKLQDEARSKIITSGEFHVSQTEKIRNKVTEVKIHSEWEQSKENESSVIYSVPINTTISEYVTEMYVDYQSENGIKSHELIKTNPIVNEDQIHSSPAQNEEQNNVYKSVSSLNPSILNYDLSQELRNSTTFESNNNTSINYLPSMKTHIYKLLNTEDDIFQIEKELIDNAAMNFISTESPVQSALNTNISLQKALSYTPIKNVEKDNKTHNTTHITLPNAPVMLDPDTSVTIYTSINKTLNSQSLHNNSVTSLDKKITTTIKTPFDYSVNITKTEPISVHVSYHSSIFETSTVTSAAQNTAKTNVLHKVEGNNDLTKAKTYESVARYQNITNGTDMVFDVNEQLTNISFKTSTKNHDMKHKNLKNAKVSQDQIISTIFVPITMKKNEKLLGNFSNKYITKNKDTKNIDHNNSFTKTIFITSGLTNDSTKERVLKNIVKPKLIFHSNLSKHRNLVKTPISFVKYAKFSQENSTDDYYNQTHSIDDTYSKQKNYNRISVQPKYVALLERSGHKKHNQLAKESKLNHDTTKSIVYNTYKPLTEEELTLPPDVKKIKTRYSTIYTKEINAIKSLLNVASKPRTKQNKYIFKSKRYPSTDKYIKTSLYNIDSHQDTLINDTIYRFTNNTYLHPIEKLSKQTQWKSSNRIQIKNSKRPIIMMHTDDFRSFRRPVTKKLHFFEKLNPNPAPRRPINVPTVQTRAPKRVILRPKFNSFEDLKMSARRVMPKENIMHVDRDYYRNNFQFRHRPGQFWREKVGEVRTNKRTKPLEPQRRSGVETAKRINFQPVIDVPYYMPTVLKPYFLRDKVESIRSYIYNEDRDVVNGRRHFKSPPRVEKSGVMVDASDTQEHMYYSAEKSSEQTHTSPTTLSPSPQVTDYWLEDLYLKVRLPLPINSNPGMVFPGRKFAKVDEVADLAALFIDDLLDYKEMLDRGELPLERATSREKGQPLCMAQFYRLLGVCRIPQLGKDRLELPPMRPEGEQEELVVVACRNYFYPIPVKAADRGRLTPGEIQAQLLMAMVDAAGAPSAPRVGLLSSLPRDAWARARDILCEDETNRHNMELISRALCIVCLDEAGGDRADVDSDTNAFLRAMHGAGTKHHSANRWFDKTVQLIISSDGTVGMCYEHSAAEGVAVVRLAERALARAAVAARPAPPPALLPAPQAMKWTLTTDVERMIEQAGREIDRNIADLDVKVYTYKGYGREYMKSCRTSPDVYIQLAMQYAYYKMYGHLVPTYESASLRRFLEGRVDNIRSAHPPALAWAKAMCADETPPLSEAEDSHKKEQKKLELFDEAAKKQTAIMEANILGRGIDNHLLALRETARAQGPLPDLFTDPTYKLMNEFKLSTSQVATTTDGTFMGYGAVVPDGYGCCYNPKKDSIIFCISSFVSSSVTNTEAFRQSLEEALDSMKLMFQHRQN